MKTKVQRALLGLGMLCCSQIDVHAQITKLKDYENKTSAAIGIFQGINYREAGFSGLFAIAGTNGKEFWTVSDRGVNIDAASANLPECRPTYDKLYGFPSYAPKIHRIRISGDSIQILQTITMKRPNGANASGLLNPTGFGSTSTEVVSTGVVTDCADFNANTAQKDVWGIDSEGIVVDKDGNFWICEEGGPTIWKLNKNGVVVKRFTPYANLAGAEVQDIAIDPVFQTRKNNRGFENIAITPSGKIYALIQSPLLNPSKTVGEATQVHRMLEIDPATNDTRMFVYLNEGVVGAAGANQIRMSDWKLGDMAAISDTTFLVIEAAARGTSDYKKIYQIGIKNATPVTSGLYGGLSLEALTDQAGLTANSIVPVKKILFLDLLANGWNPLLDKAEGLAIINDSTIAICNDNDYGQSSPTANGIGTATGNLGHVVVYGLKGANKLPNYKASVVTLAQGTTGLNSSQSPYVEAFTPGVKLTSILTAGDAVGNYKMAGTPDGLGAFDNGDETFTVLMNHEFGNTAGAVRAHGSIGAFVSKWVINKSDLTVISGSDLIQNVKLWNKTTNSYDTYNTANPLVTPFNRFCSADLPAVSAFYNSATGLGTEDRIFMNGEEAGDEGKGMAHIVTGTEAGTSYELPALGKFSWENAVASPTAGDKTIVAGLDDTTPGQVYIYVGTKTNTGITVEKAGLTNGKLYGVAITGLVAETNASVPAANSPFTLKDLGDVTNKTGAVINTESNNAGVTTFLRPEDGAWDPANPSDFYFATTNNFSANSRLWKLHFTDIANPEQGGTITAVLDGSEGQKMLDNITVDHYGHVLMVEDVGGNAHIGKIWQYNTKTDVLKQIAQHDSTRFFTGGANFLTIDEEATGILDVQDILGAGMFIVADQAHYAQPGELVEGGQLLALYNPDTYKASVGAGATSSQDPYLLPVAPGVIFNSIITAGDAVGNYKMAGTPDGLGAFDNGDETFTVLMNHEFGNTAGAVRAHGSIGAFVSKWVINKSDLTVISGSDLIQNVKLWNKTTNSYDTYNTANPLVTPFNRFCSADLPAVSAFYNGATGLGTEDRIFMNGEEAGDEGKGMAHIVTGTEAGTSYELPALGKFSWENAVASPTAGDKTIVAGLDDTTPGQVYIYVGTKTNTGITVEKAGLTNGKLYGVAITGLVAETNASVPTENSPFTLKDLGDVTNKTGAVINTESNNAGVTTFLRPEDGAWDPANPSDFYFATTNNFSANSRLWKLHFTDIANPEQGGTITAVLDGSEGQKMLDNITVDHYGHVLMVEDVGGNAHIGKIWQYNTKTDAMTLIAKHDENRFLATGSNFLTIDEEATGILDVQEILGAGMFIVADQAHYAQPGELVEGGQLLKFFNPDTYAASQVATGIEDGVLSSESFVVLYPNPAGNTATVYMNLDRQEHVTIRVYDAQGRVVSVLGDTIFEQGEQKVTLNTSVLSNGIYIVEVSTLTTSVKIRTVIIH